MADELKTWNVKSVEEFERFTHNPGAPLPKIVTTADVANAIQDRGHGQRFRQHPVEIVSAPAPQSRKAIEPTPVPAQAAPR